MKLNTEKINLKLLKASLMKLLIALSLVTSSLTVLSQDLKGRQDSITCETQYKATKINYVKCIQLNDLKNKEITKRDTIISKQDSVISYQKSENTNLKANNEEVRESLLKENKRKKTWRKLSVGQSILIILTVTLALI